MRSFRMAALAVVALLTLAVLTPVAMAGNDDPLFVNLTTDDAHRAKMALVFSGKQQARKHPLTIFLNDKAVVLAAKSKAGAYAEHQAAIADILKAGGTVLICPMCMKHYGVEDSDLVEGVVVSDPDKVSAALFADDVKTLTW